MVQDYCISILGETCKFPKGILHLAKDSTMICRGIACWKQLIYNFLKGTLQKMTHASLQQGEASLLYLILHLEQECNVLDSCYILLQKHISPSKEGCTFEGSPEF